MHSPTMKPAKSLGDTGQEPSPELLLRLYREMLRLRTLDERMMTLQRPGRVGFYGACTRQDAAALASAVALEPSDSIFPAARGGGAVVLRGFPLGPCLSQVDGNDTVAVYAAVKEAVDRARAGGGPTLVECETYRIGAHSSSDDPTRYRDEREVEVWRKRDPIERLRARLGADGLWTDRQDEELRARLLDEVNAAIAEAEQKPDPPREGLFEDVYSNLPWFLREQRDELLASPPAPRPDAKKIAGR